MNSNIHPSVALYKEIYENKVPLWPFKTHIL